MIVIAKHTHERLLCDLLDFKRNYPSEVCYYMKFSEALLARDELFSKFISILQSTQELHTGQLYIFPDKDTFLLMKGLEEAKFRNFIKMLADSLGSNELLGLVYALEVERYWEKLEKICLDKLNTSDQKEELELAIENPPLINNDIPAVFSGVAPELIKSINERRQARDKILIQIVDDDMLTRTLVSNVFKHKYDFCFAKDGQQTLSGYVRDAPDLVFLDIGLPDMSGHAVLGNIMLVDPLAYIIMLSGRKDGENVMKALELGAQGFVGKPFSKDKLFHYIKKIPAANKNVSFSVQENS